MTSDEIPNSDWTTSQRIDSEALAEVQKSIWLSWPRNEFVLLHVYAEVSHMQMAWHLLFQHQSTWTWTRHTQVYLPLTRQKSLFCKANVVSLFRHSVAKQTEIAISHVGNAASCIFAWFLFPGIFCYFGTNNRPTQSCKLRQHTHSAKWQFLFCASTSNIVFKSFSALILIHMTMVSKPDTALQYCICILHMIRLCPRHALVVSPLWLNWF